ncbi:MAG: serine hydrolase domain-containing protein [Fulvivirga sp.]|uniref:serine hydrolase domain-containing protein n=1 Tax=Fulvivirga sp. TaxID=1931237 RepID=UPI0032EDA356
MKLNNILTALFLLLFSGPALVAQNAQLESKIRKWVQEKKLHGVSVMIKQHDSVIFEQQFGQADIEQHKSLTADSRFRIFSMTKPVISLATLKCLHDNKLSLNTRLDQIFTDFESDEPITIRQILTHTAGFSYGGEFSWQGFQYWLYDPLEKSEDLNEFMERLSGLSLGFDPGTAWEYSISHDVLGAVIEKVSGLRLEDYMRREIFNPLGMMNTGFIHKGESINNLVKFYRYDKEADKAALLEDQYAYDKVITSGGGGLYSTANDYMKFLDVLLFPERYADLLPEEVIRQLSKNQLAASIGSIPESIYPDSGFGFGVGVQLTAGEYLPKDSFYWAGMGGTMFWVDPKNELQVVAMTQSLGHRRFMESYFIPLVYESLWLVGE